VEVTTGTSLRLFRVDEVNGARALSDPSVVYDAVTGATPMLDLGECWPALHVLISAGESPIPRDVALSLDVEWDDGSLENVLMGGEATEYEDALSVARYHSPSRVVAMCGLLRGISADEILARFDESVMEYLPRARRSIATRRELVERFKQIVEWYAVARSAHAGILIYAREVAMKPLIRVGFYQELRHGRPDGGSLRASLRPSSGPDDTRLVAYLRSGTAMVVAAGIVRDVLDNSIIGGLDIRTDGTYAWPSDFPHYIEKHHATPPPELIEHARAYGFTCPTGIEIGQLKLP
jgi:hypothetical protein